MIRFHPSYARIADIHQRLLEHIKTIVLPGGIHDNAFFAPYTWFDIITVATAAHLSNLKADDKRLEKLITSYTQEQVFDLSWSNHLDGGRKFFSLMVKGKVLAEFHPYDGTIKLRGATYLIDIFDQTLKPERFDDLICEDTVDFHAVRLQSYIAQRHPDILPDLETIAKELLRVSGIDLGFSARQVPAQFTLLEGVMPMTVNYAPNGVINTFPAIDQFRRNIDLLQHITSKIKVWRESGEMPVAVGISHFHMNESHSGQSVSHANISITLQYKNLTSMLTPTIEVRRVYCNGDMTKPQSDAYRNADQVVLREYGDTIAHKLNQAIAKDQKLVANTLKRRRSKKKEHGGRTQIDLVGQAMIEIIDRINPEKGQEIRSGMVKFFRLKPSEGGEFFSGHPEHKDGKINMKSISFRNRDGEFHARMELSDGHIWENDRLSVYPAMPEIMTESLKGKAASEVIDHPISAMLGPVKKATNVAGRTEIKFEKIIRDIE